MKMFWNGVGLTVPDDWEVARIGKSRLTFRRGDRPVADIQWRRGDASVNFPAVIEQRKRTCRKRGDVLSPISFPKEMPQPNDVEWGGFEWENDEWKGIEILRLCRRCRTVTDFRWTVSSGISGRVPISWVDILAVLDGFSDHETAFGIRFALYDIEVIVPQDFRLERYAFYPGLFELQFQAERGNIRFLRWAAAAERLRNHSLESFAEMVCGKSEWTACHDPSIGDVRIGYPQPQGWLGRVLSARHRSWFLIRLDRNMNRILGVYYRGKKAHPHSEILRFGRMVSIAQEETRAAAVD